MTARALRVAGGTTADQINRLHELATESAQASRQSLNAALAAAWEAGQLLLTEKKRVRHSMGPGAWILWLEQSFRGTPRTAQRYMRLARSVTDAEFLQGMSLRQAYARLGISTEPKTRAQCAPLPKLPPHVVLANKLVGVLHPRGLTPEQGATYRRDLRALYEQLRPLFEHTAANFPAPTLSERV